jgi:hypothetical protein
MKNLYQKLSDENQQKLKDFSKQYPTTGDIIIEVLKSNYSWSLIRLGDALSIWNAIDVYKPFDFNGFTELFEN